MQTIVFLIFQLMVENNRSRRQITYMLFAGGEVRIAKNCYRVHSFSPDGPTLSR